MPSAIAVRNVGTIGRADALPAYVPRIFTVINKLLDHLAISILFGPHEDFHLIANLHEIKGIICEVGSYRRTAKKRPPSRSLQLRENGGRLKINRRFNPTSQKIIKKRAFLQVPCFLHGGRLHENIPYDPTCQILGIAAASRMIQPAKFSALQKHPV